MLNKLIKATSLCWMMGIALTAGAQDLTHTQEKPCQGAWDIELFNSKAEFTQDSAISAWLPGELVLTRELAMCLQSVVIGPGNSNYWELSSAQGKLRVQPYDAQKNPLTQTTDGSGWIFPVREGSTHQPFWLRIFDMRYASPGIYEGSVETRYDSVFIDAVNQTQQQERRIHFQVEPRASMHFDSSGTSINASGTSYYRVNLGSIETGSQQTFDMILSSNSGVTVTVSSQNKGYLVHESVPGAQIGYQLTVDSLNVNLAERSSVDLPQMAFGGRWRVPLEVSVPYVAKNARAGEYSDIITFDIFAND